MAIYKKTLKNTNKNTSETILFDGSSNTGADSAIITTGGGLGKVTVADGSNIYNLNSTKDAQSFTGGKGADSFVIKVNKLAGVTIDGGTSTQLAYNGTTGAFTSVADDAAKTYLPTPAPWPLKPISSLIPNFRLQDVPVRRPTSIKVLRFLMRVP